MKVAILFSGGKDSNYAGYLASKEHEVICLISIISKNLESYMFQTPGNEFIKYQAQCLNLPLVKYETAGEKEEELKDLKKAIKVAIDKYGIEGIVTGAIKSVYQASRIQKICDELKIWCFNPLWQIDEKKFLKSLIKDKFQVMIIGIFSYPFKKEYLGRILDNLLYSELVELEKKYKINPAGEGGELETFVIDSPMFKKRIQINDFKRIMDSENSGILKIGGFEFIGK